MARPKNRGVLDSALLMTVVSATQVMALRGVYAAEPDNIPLAPALKSFIEDAPRPLSLSLKSRDGSIAQYIIDVDEQGDGTVTYRAFDGDVGHKPTGPFPLENFDGGYLLGTTKLARSRLKDRLAQLWREIYTSTNSLVAIDLKINRGTDAHLQAAPLRPSNTAWLDNLFRDGTRTGSAVSVLEKQTPSGETPFWEETRYETAPNAPDSSSMLKAALRGRKTRHWLGIEEFRDEGETDPSDWMAAIGTFVKLLKKAQHGVTLTTPGPIRYGEVYEVRVDASGRGKAQVFDASGAKPFPVFAWSFKLGGNLGRRDLPVLADEAHQVLKGVDVSGIQLTFDSGDEVETGALYRDDLEEQVHFTKHGSRNIGWTWRHFTPETGKLVHTYHTAATRSAAEEERRFTKKRRPK